MIEFTSEEKPVIGQAPTVFGGSNMSEGSTATEFTADEGYKSMSGMPLQNTRGPVPSSNSVIDSPAG